MEKIRLFDMCGVYGKGFGNKDGNHKIFEMYKTTEAFENDIMLCGGDETGILNEESLDTVLEHSGIEWLGRNKVACVLRQGDKFFSVKILENKDGSTEVDSHIDFNTVKELIL